MHRMNFSSRSKSVTIDYVYGWARKCKFGWRPDRNCRQYGWRCFWLKLKILINIYLSITFVLLISERNKISQDSRDFTFQAQSSFLVLICTLLIISLISIFLSAWLAKTITDSSMSFNQILHRYLGIDRNESESSVRWWKPVEFNSSVGFDINLFAIQKSTTTMPITDDYHRFRMIGLPCLLIASIILAIITFYTRMKYNTHRFTCIKVPRISKINLVDQENIEMFPKNVNIDRTSN